LSESIFSQINKQQPKKGRAPLLGVDKSLYYFISRCPGFLIDWYIPKGIFVMKQLSNPIIITPIRLLSLIEREF